MSRLVYIFIFSILTACVAAPPEQRSIADLKDKPPVIALESKPRIDTNPALSRYRDFLKETADDATYREALRRLADLELEAAEKAKDAAASMASGQAEAQDAIDLYEKYLRKYEGDDNNERVLYQLAKAYDLTGQLEKSLAALERLLREYPRGVYAEEALFRSGEMHFSLRETSEAEQDFRTIVEKYPDSIFYERSLYMDGWSLYLDNHYPEALKTFFKLLDRKVGERDLVGAALGANLSRADRELLDDSLKVICFSLSYLGDTGRGDNIFASLADRPYESLIYRRLGEFYLDKGRFGDAAKTFLGLAQRNPDHVLAPLFHQYAINAYRAGGFGDLFLGAKSQFVALYGVDSRYWQTHDEAGHNVIRPYLEEDIKDLASHFHSAAQRSNTAKDFDVAIKWYKEYLKTFPSGAKAAEMNFLLAECLHDAKRYSEAITEYERTAYQYDLHKTSAEAGYAALLGYWQVLPDLPEVSKTEWRRKTIESSLRFSERFPEDNRVNSVLAKATEELYAMHDYAGTIEAARRLLNRPFHKNDDTRSNIWIILGHAQFETSDYVNAEQAYQAALGLLPDKDPRKAGLIENLAASIYKQGEQHHAEGDLKAAIASFLRIEKAAPTSSIALTAQYDAAALLIELENWPTATSILEGLRGRGLADNRLRIGVIEKLVFVYMKTGQKRLAAHEMEALAATYTDDPRRKDIIWEAATLYQSLDEKKDAIRLYERYIDEFPTTVTDAIEARYQLSILYDQLGKSDKSLYWSQEIIEADRTAGARRTERTRHLAGDASLRLAQPPLKAYQSVKLVLPLKKSLNVKKKLMERVIAIYKKALEYHIAEVTTAATYQLGSIYSQFAKAIMSSDRPRGLSKDELDQYDILLEEQAFGFEEKAIKLHEANLRHISDGIYDSWIKDSLRALAALYPIRYAKTEQSEAFFDVSQ
jgi:TolA-binding protein